MYYICAKNCALIIKGTILLRFVLNRQTEIKSKAAVKTCISLLGNYLHMNLKRAGPHGFPIFVISLLLSEYAFNRHLS